MIIISLSFNSFTSVSESLNIFLCVSVWSFGSILVLAATEESLSQGILLLSFYSIGLAIPFILSGYLIQRFLIFSKNFRKNINLVSKIGGIILLITGILILTNQLQALGYYLLNIFPFLQNFG